METLRDESKRLGGLLWLLRMASVTWEPKVETPRAQVGGSRKTGVNEAPEMRDKAKSYWFSHSDSPSWHTRVKKRPKAISVSAVCLGIFSNMSSDTGLASSVRLRVCALASSQVLHWFPPRRSSSSENRSSREWFKHGAILQSKLLSLIKPLPSFSFVGGSLCPGFMKRLSRFNSHLLYEDPED